MTRRLLFLIAVASLAGVSGVAAAAAPSGWSEVLNIDLAKPFRAASPWRLVAVQGPSEPVAWDPTDKEPGPIRLCLVKSATAPCDEKVELPRPKGWDPRWGPRFIQLTRIVHPHGGDAPPMLVVRTGSDYSGDGDQARNTQVFAYRAESDRFERVFDQTTGRNNNEEIRYIETGPLRGDVVVVEPTEKAPFGFWVTVSKPMSGDRYKAVLKYRSATRYADGNPLAVIDSEMPNIERRLGFWRPGQPLPLPAKGCAKPLLAKMELWCGPPVPFA